MDRVLRRQRHLEAQQEAAARRGEERHASIDEEFGDVRDEVERRGDVLADLERRVTALEELVAKTIGKAK